MPIEDDLSEIHRTSNDPFESLAFISGWSKAWWTISWDALTEIETYAAPIQDQIDELWSFIVRVTLRTKVSPIEITDMVLDLFGLESISQHLQRL